jgi:hypothetical protein
MTGQNENATPVGSATSSPEERETKPEGSSNSDELAQLQVETHKFERFQESGFIVHSLRNSANSILVAAEYLIEDAANVLTEEHVALLRGAMRSALSILQILENVADPSKGDVPVAMKCTAPDRALGSS